jgi:O-antigen/teichoic acid export membrane protein
LVGVISSYAQLSDFGITESLIKFTAEYSSKKDSKRLNEVLNTSFVLYSTIGVALCLLFLFCMGAIVDDVLNIPSHFRETAIQVYSLSVMLFFINMISGIFGSMLIGFQRMDYSNAIQFVTSLLNAVGTVFSLKMGYGLLGLVINNAVSTSFVILGNYLAARRLFPGLRLSPVFFYDKNIARKVFDYSWKVQITYITQLMIFQVDRILLSHYLGLAAVSKYELANRTASQAKTFILSLFSPMVPAASSFDTTHGVELIAGLYRRSFKYMASVAIPLSALVVTLAHPFVRTWVGAGYDTTAYTLQFLAAAYLVNVLTAPGSFIMSGTNKPQVNMRYSIIAAAINVAGCLLLIRLVGYFGIILSIFLSVTISGIHFILKVREHIPGLERTAYRNTLVKPVLITAPLCLILYLIDMHFTISGYLTLTILSTAFLLIYCMIHLRGNYFDDFDLLMFKKLISSAAAIIKDRLKVNR